MEEPDAIAIVGVGCRFPGAQNLDEFWDVLKNGENHVIEVPKDRWNVDAFYDSDPDAPGKTYVRKVGIVKDHDKFDNRLFDVNEIEASKMDPQQRFILESTFMALENGGFPRKDISSSNTGVYVGVMNSDYTDILASDMDQADNYTLTGGSASIAAARVSYVFNLLGPALAVDTACSSALVAIHLASQALAMGDCDMAICGGVNSVMMPSMMIPLSKARMVSPTGASRAFSAEADGYARGEGAGIVILRRLADAKANGDRIWSVIKTASNQDGRMASPITAPSGQQQQALLKETYTRYGINPADVQYIEAHGTGTPVGDPIEATSLGNYFGVDGSERFIGSVKTNIGHLESAAGIAGLIKVLLMMKHNTIVPSLHFSSPNPKIDFETFNFKVPAECCPWETLPDGRRVACVNSFGFGGSNAHAVVIQQPDIPNDCINRTDGHCIVAISGHSKQAVKGNIAHLIKMLTETEMDPNILSYTSTCRRDHYRNRVAVHVGEEESLLHKLKVLHVESIEKKRLHLVFVFGGMGTSWPGMCRQFITRNQHFLQSVRDIDTILKHFVDISLENEFQHQVKLHDPIVGPLMLFACQVGLFSVWKAWGVMPNAVLGQSVGEVAAAYASGRVNLEDAVKIIFYRTELLSKVTGGQMLVILNYQVSEVEKLCYQFDGRLNIAVYYSPTACSISGDEVCVQAVRKTLEERKGSGEALSVIPLNVTTAFHSQRMDSLTKPLAQKLVDIRSFPSEISIYSTVSGKLADETDFTTPEYWAQNLRQCVLFSQAVSEARDQDARTVYIELGPKPVLRAHLQDIFENDDVMVLSSMEKESDMACLLDCICRLYSLGVNPSWNEIVPQYHGQLTDDPKYQFRRSKLLYEPDVSRRYRDGTRTNLYDHPFVDRLSGGIPTFKIDINERITPFIFQHVVNGMIFVPGAFYTEVALAVGSEVLRMPPYTLTVSAHYIQPLRVQRGQDYILTCQVKNPERGKVAFVIYKQREIFAHGHIEKRTQKAMLDASVLRKIKHRCHNVNSKAEIYDLLASRGFVYGEDLSIVTQAYSNSTECLASIVPSDLINSQLYRTHFHPCVLDAMTQALCTIGIENGQMPHLKGKQVLPAGLGSVSLFQSLERHMLSYGKVVMLTPHKFFYNSLLMTTSGNVIAEVKDLVVKVVGGNADEVDRITYSLEWIPEQTNEHYEPGQTAVIISDDKCLINAIASNSDETKYIPYHVTASKFDMDELKSNLGSQSTSCNRTLQSSGINSVIFNFGRCSTGDIECAGDLFDSASLTCTNLRKLLTDLSEEDSNVFVTVLTRSTQVLPFRESMDKSVNMHGSQLWGMVRCLLKESLYPYVQIIDILDDSKPTLSCLNKYVLNTSGLEPGEREIVISQGIPHSSTVEFSRATESSLIGVEQNWNRTDNVRLMEYTKGTEKTCHFYLEYSDIDQQMPFDHIQIALEKVLLHKDALLPSRKSGELEVWPAANGASSQLVCLEAQGNNRKTNEPVIVCLPLEVTNVVSVPPECVIPLRLIQGYHVGIATLLVFGWIVHETVRPHGKIVIITDDLSADQGKLIQGILFLYGHKKSTSIFKGDILNITISEPTSILLLTDLEQHVLEQMLEVHQLHIQVLIALKGCRGDATLKGCFIKTCTVVRIGPKEWFQQAKLRKILPKIVRVLCKKKSKSAHIFEGLGNNHFKTFSRGFLDLKDKGDLKILVTSGNLFRHNACYLVVGGLGGLGWLTVCLIAEKGGGLVAAVSRKPPSPEMQSKIDDLKEHTGVNIVCLQADVSDEVSVAKALNHLSNNFPMYPLRGVFHGAGVLDDGFLMRMSKEKFDRVCMPKILGTYNLHQLTEHLNLDYFVMYSSVVSIAGNAGQSNYGAGNSFMDTFAHYRRSKGLAGQSINWGPLEVGMALHNDQIRQQLAKYGFVSLNEDQIKNCLIHALVTNSPQICFMDFDWIEKLRFLFLKPDIRPIMKTGGKDPNENELPSCIINIDLLKLQPEAERLSMLFEYIREVIGQVLNIDGDDITYATSVASLGLDSMLAMTVVNQIRKDLSVKLSLVYLLEDPCVEVLIKHLDKVIMSGSSVDDDVELTSAEISSSRISVLESAAYNVHRKWAGERDIVFGAEIYLTIPAPLEWVKNMLIAFIGRHQALHTLYVPDEDGIRPVVVADLSDMHILTLESSQGSDLKNEITELSKKPFDLSVEIPVRILCSQIGEKYTLGFIFHSICFDLKSINIFFMEFKEFALASFNRVDIPSPKNVNVAAKMSGMLMQKLNSLQEFWKPKVNLETRVSLISFSTQTVKPEIVCGYHEHVIKEIPSNLGSQIDKLLLRWNVTLFQMLASSYHLLLHLVSGEATIALRTAVDTRLHIPALEGVMARCANGVPLIASVEDNDTIESFVISNSKEIMHCVDMGAYPFSWITKHCSEETTTNMLRHSVVAEDLTGLVSASKGLELFKFDFRSHGPLKTNHETRLLIWTKQGESNAVLQLDYLPTLISLDTANAVLDSLFALLDYMSCNPDCIIKNIPHDILITTCQTVKAQINSSVDGTSATQSALQVIGQKKEMFINDEKIHITEQNKLRKEDVFSKTNVNNKAVRSGFQAFPTTQITASKTFNDVSMGIGSIIFNGSFFTKTTHQGWDHKVFLKVDTSGGNCTLRWGRSKGALIKHLPLAAITQISLNYIHDTFALIVRTPSRRFYFKTGDRNQAEHWMKGLRESLDQTATRSPTTFVMAENFMLY